MTKESQEVSWLFNDQMVKLEFGKNNKKNMDVKVKCCRGDIFQAYFGHFSIRWALV